MDIVPLDLAFLRFGADCAGRQRLMSATAQDGSLVLVCQSAGFTRPGTGVLRYSAQLSLISGRRPQVQALRQGLEAAHSSGAAVRLIIQTPGDGRTSTRHHVRADLTGRITAFDGDSYSVDFVREEVEAPEVEVRTKRKR
jgi:hypothetical protein